MVLSFYVIEASGKHQTVGLPQAAETVGRTDFRKRWGRSGGRLRRPLQERNSLLCKKHGKRFAVGTVFAVSVKVEFPAVLHLQDVGGIFQPFAEGIDPIRLFDHRRKGPEGELRFLRRAKIRINAAAEIA